MAKNRRYPTYRDSGVEWLGEIPEHWEVRRVKSICRFAYGGSLPAETRIDGTIPVYGSNGIVGSSSVPNTNGPCLIIGRKGSFGKGFIYLSSQRPKEQERNQYEQIRQDAKHF